MKQFKKVLLLTIFFAGLSMTTKAEEITLFNSEGEAIAYIDAEDEDLTIYMWNGTPVAYLDPNGDTFNIYGFNGEHLGWFEDGIVRAHVGYAVGFRKVPLIFIQNIKHTNHTSNTNLIRIKEYAPYKPTKKSIFRRILYFLNERKKITKAITSPILKQGFVLRRTESDKFKVQFFV
jgi:hypothetical protein